MDALLLFVSFGVNLSLREPATPDNLQDILEILWLDPFALVTFHKFPEFFEELVVWLGWGHIFGEEAQRAED